MHYIIDGYNLLFRLKPESDEKLRSQRTEIIQDINKKASLLNLNVTIVFDAAFQIGDSSQSHFDHIEILFTSEGETADEYILEELKNSPRPEQETVITSDKKLAWLARRRSAHTENVDEFVSKLNRSYKNKLRKEKHTKITSSLPAPKKIEDASQNIPLKEITPDQCTDYYIQAFETRYNEFLKNEKPKKKPDKPPRRHKKRIDPFAMPETPSEKAASEIDRWLKIFEKRL